MLFNANTFTIEEEFHKYVKPKVNPTLTSFCIDLTGIQQVFSKNPDTFLHVELGRCWASVP